MPRGGRRLGAGRPKGSQNLRTRVREEAAKRAGTAGTSPLEFLLAIMRNEDRPLKVRLAAAKAAMPFCHPRLSATTHVTIAEAPSHEEMLQALLDEDYGWGDDDFVTPSVTPGEETWNSASAEAL